MLREFPMSIDFDAGWVQESRSNVLALTIWFKWVELSLTCFVYGLHVQVPWAWGNLLMT